MRITDKLSLFQSESHVFKLFGYIMYLFAILCIIALLTPLSAATDPLELTHEQPPISDVNHLIGGTVGAF